MTAATPYYEQLQALAATGQAHFEPRDEARYNDYEWDPAPEPKSESEGTTV